MIKQDNQSIEIYDEKKTTKPEAFEPEIQNTTINNGANSISASLLTNIQGLKTLHKKQVKNPLIIYFYKARKLLQIYKELSLHY